MRIEKYFTYLSKKNNVFNVKNKVTLKLQPIIKKGITIIHLGLFVNFVKEIESKLYFLGTNSLPSNV